MKNRRIFVPAQDVRAGSIVFEPKTSSYLARVLRLKPGDEVEAFDGESEYLVRLTGTKGRQFVGEVLQTSEEHRPAEPDITLAFGCIRPGPFREILRHCTELGVLRFVPILSLRTSRRPEEKKDRWESVVASASAQSQRVRVPIVEAPASIERFVLRDFGNAAKFVLSLASDAPPLLAMLDYRRSRQVLLLLGPEGGFDPAEEALAVTAGFTPVCLGKGVLRTETAAVVAVGITVITYAAADRGPERQETCD